MMAKVKAKAKTNVTQPPPPPPPHEPEETCFHDYVEHLKRLQGGDYKKPSLKDCVSFQLCDWICE